MSRPGQRPEQPSLFDLELDPAPDRSEPEAPDDDSRAVQAEVVAADRGEPPGAEEPVSLAARAYGGATDLLAQLAVTAILLLGLRLMGIGLGAPELAAVAVVLLVFSLFYTVIPLAFWGRTPGMALSGAVSRGVDGEPLSFGQAGWRWIGGVATVLTAGLPLLLALRGPSLSDRLSASRTWAIE